MVRQTLLAAFRTQGERVYVSVNCPRFGRHRYASVSNIQDNNECRVHFPDTSTAWIDVSKLTLVGDGSRPKPYQTGDGKGFATMLRAVRHANAIHLKTGTFICIEETGV